MTLARRCAVGAALTLALAACAGSPPVPPSTRAPAPAAPRSAADASPEAAAPDPLPSLDALGARAPTLAPGMRETLRGDRTADETGAVALVSDAGVDTCVRVAFAAAPPVRVTLVDPRNRETLAESSDAGDVALGAAGPVCVRRGGGVSLEVRGGAGWRARFVAWRSPAGPGP